MQAQPPTMRSMVLQSNDDGSYQLQATTLPTPRPQANEVLVRVHAASLNYRDLLIAQGKAGLKDLHGRIPLSDGAGEVVAVGEGVDGFSPGDRVAGTFFSYWSDGPFEMRYHQHALGGSASGMLAEFVILPDCGLVKIPDHLTYIEAATLPCAGVTAWHALTRRGQLRENQTVLVLGTGGVSVFALQIAHAMNARVIVTSSSDEKLARARKLGASSLVNYIALPTWDKEVWSLTEKRGVDVVIEVGGGGTLARSINCVSAGGHIALIGVLTGFDAPSTGLFPLTTKNASLEGIYVGSRQHFTELNQFLTQHQLRPVVDRVFPLEDIQAAYHYMQSASHFGKIAIEIT